jgi:hypothetical protein
MQLAQPVRWLFELTVGFRGVLHVVHNDCSSTLRAYMPLAIFIVVLLVAYVVVRGIRREAKLSERKGVPEGDVEIPFEVLSEDSASHHSKHAGHDRHVAPADSGHGHHGHGTHHDSGSFHDSGGHSSFDGGAFHGGHH